MEGGKVTKTRLVLVSLLILGVFALALGIAGCGSDTTTTTTAAPATDTTAAPSSDTTAAPTGEAETLRIGLLTNKGWPLGVNFLMNMDVWEAMVNNAGGFDVGGKKYKIEFVSYDHTGDQAQAISYMNRLVFEDKVRYVFSDPSVVDPLIAIAEKNKVIYACSFPTQALIATTNNYSFYADATVTLSGNIPNWLKQAYPGKNKIAVIYPDSEMGHVAAEVGGGTVFIKSLGFELTQIFVPPAHTDLSSIGTKIATVNPDFVTCQATGDQIQGSVFNAAYAAGYRGVFVNGGAQSIEDGKAFINPDALNLMVQFASGLAFDPPTNDVGKAFKAEWIAQNGNFENGSLDIGEPFTPWLIAAMQKAGSIEPDALGPAVKSGLTWTGAFGSYQMIGPNSPDDPTTQCMVDISTMKVVDGVGVLVDYFPLEQTIKWYYENVAALAASQGN